MIVRGVRQRIVMLDDYERAADAFADFSSIRARADVSIHTQRLTGDALLDAIKDADVLVLMRDRTPLAAFWRARSRPTTRAHRIPGSRFRRPLAHWAARASASMW